MYKHWIIRLEGWSPYKPMEVLEPNQELLEETIRFMADKECIALTIDDPVNRTEEGFMRNPLLYLLMPIKVALLLRQYLTKTLFSI